MEIAMRISRVVAATAVTGAAMAAALGAFQLTSDGSHPAGGRPTAPANHIGSQVDFNTGAQDPNKTNQDEINEALSATKLKCDAALRVAKDDATRAQIQRTCDEQIADLNHKLQDLLAAAAVVGLTVGGIVTAGRMAGPHAAWALRRVVLTEALASAVPTPRSRPCSGSRAVDGAPMRSVSS
jgi:hypothetical protein